MCRVMVMIVRWVWVLTIFNIPYVAVAETIIFSPRPDLEYAVQAALDQAKPGDTIILPAGQFRMTQELAIAVPFVTLKGQGADQTILSYDEGAVGPEAIMVTANHVTIEDLTIRNHPGDGIKSTGVKGISIRRNRIEWTKHRDPENGAYGIYPVLSRQVLVEDNHVIGASDAGIYVGQSEQIIVRQNRVEGNVAGIEIENSQFADVYDNDVTGNTGGILVFDLPNLTRYGGKQTRVFRNRIYRNNLANFASEGNSVAMVPQGTGILIMANDEVEIFDNRIDQHNTTSIAIVSYHVTESHINDPRYDPIPEKIFVHHNQMTQAGRFPIKDGNALALIAGFHAFPFRVPHIVYDGIGRQTSEGHFEDAALQGDRRLCFYANKVDGYDREFFGNFNLHRQSYWDLVPGRLNINASEYDCQHQELPPVDLEIWPNLPPEEDLRGQELSEDVCEHHGNGVNWNALDYDCPKLSDYRLFIDPRNPQEEAVVPGFKYTLSNALFSDYTVKDRFIFIPDHNKISYHASGIFTFPVGSVISKTFALPSDLQHPSSPSRLIETRLLIRRQEGWRALVYQWDESGSEASLRFGGAPVPLAYLDQNGKQQSFTYQIPHLQRCSGCHNNNAPIGIQAKFLNLLVQHNRLQKNQLEVWNTLGHLTDLPEDLNKIPKLPRWDHPADGSLDARARAYLDINCAHCHQPSGQASTSGLYLNYEQVPNIHLGICKPPIAAGRGSGGILFDIVPGHPDQSILLQRLADTRAAIKMPEIDKALVHKEGVELIRSWILSLQGTCDPSQETVVN